MKKEDLRIGNYIKTKGIFDDRCSKVTQINIDYIQSKFDDLTHHYVGYDCIEPIELTEELIAKIKNFKKSDYWDNKYQLIKGEYDDFFYVEFGYDVVRFKMKGGLECVKSKLYLHELQNIVYVLYGLELEIKL